MKNEKAVIGHSEHFAPVKMMGNAEVGHIANATVKGYQDGILIAEHIDD
jgi:tRNA A37 methylthiotransferase MiaB